MVTVAEDPEGEEGSLPPAWGLRVYCEGIQLQSIFDPPDLERHPVATITLAQHDAQGSRIADKKRTIAR